MKKTILVVDDDAAVRGSLEKLLKAEGYHVMTARDSAEALALFTSRKVHLVVLDINLGEEDGWETFERMAATNGSVPTIVVTAEFEQHHRAIAAGVEALIEKPMDVSLFLDIVAELLVHGDSNGLKRAPGDARYCRYFNRSSDALRRDLERRLSTPLDMSWFEHVQLETATPQN